MKSAFFFRKGALQSAKRFIASAGAAPCFVAFSKESRLAITALPMGRISASKRSTTPSFREPTAAPSSVMEWVPMTGPLVSMSTMIQSCVSRAMPRVYTGDLGMVEVLFLVFVFRPEVGMRAPAAPTQPALLRPDAVQDEIRLVGLPPAEIEFVARLGIVVLVHQGIGVDEAVSVVVEDSGARDRRLVARQDDRPRLEFQDAGDRAVDLPTVRRNLELHGNFPHSHELAH